MVDADATVTTSWLSTRRRPIDVGRSSDCRLGRWSCSPWGVRRFQKGFVDLLEAIRELQPRFEDLHLLIAGRPHPEPPPDPVAEPEVTGTQEPAASR